jgi:zinc protease
LSRKTLAGCALALGAVAACGSLSLAAPAPKSASLVDDLGPIAADPAVREGVLPNGLRYTILRNATPKGAVSIRFALIVGSYEEQDDQRGVAHFIEHMAFNGTTHFPAGSLDKVFADAGVGFGRDQNADTSLSVTDYRLDLNEADPKKLDLAFQWLRDVADGETLSEDAVERERGVILSEREARLSPAQAQRVAVEEFRQRGLRTPTRVPIGTVESISTMTAARLRAFYDRWYRPENTVVVVVGDVAPDEAEKRIRDAFSSWAGKGPKPERPPRNLPDPSRGLDVLTRADPELATGVGLCRMRAPDNVSLRTVRRLRRLSLRDAWTEILDERLARVAAQPSPPFLRASVGFEGGREAAQACLLIAPLNDDWKTALDAAATEVRRFARYGPAQDELNRALGDERSVYASAVAAADTRWTPNLASAVMNDVLSGDIVASPQEKLKDFEIAAKGLTPDLLRQEFAIDWAGNGPLISIVAPKAPDPEAVRAAWVKIASAPEPSPYQTPKDAPWAYARFGPAGAVAKREIIETPGFVRLTFRNGVVVNFKQSAFRKDLVLARVRFGAGRREIPNDKVIAAEFGASLFVQGGLGKHDADDLRRLFSKESWEPQLEMGDDAFELRGETTPAAMSDEFHILAAFLSDPGFRPILDARTPTAVDDSFRRFRASPTLVFSDAFKRAADPGDPEVLPPESELTSLRAADFARLLKPALTEAPLEITVVGDVDEASVVRLVAETFGALPPRRTDARARADTRFLKFPDGAIPEVRVTHQGSPEKAEVGVVWPLFTAEPKRRREEYALNLLSRVLADDLRHHVRQELGKTYSPLVDVRLPDRADQGYLVASLETAPGDVDLAATEIQRTAKRLAEGGLTPEMLERARSPLLTAIEVRRQTNAWWLDVLDGSAANPGQIEDALAMADLYRSITLDEVRAAAAAWLSRPPLVTKVLPAPR